MKKSYNGKVVSNLIFLIGLVSIAFVISFSFNFFGGFELKNPEQFELILGEDVCVVMNDYGSQSVSLAFSGKSLPQDKIKQRVQVKLPNLSLDGYVLRVKAYVGQSSRNTNVEFSGFNGWEANEINGYYYFTQDITKLQEIGVCSEIVLPENISLNSNVYYSLIFTAELVFDEKII